MNATEKQRKWKWLSTMLIIIKKEGEQTSKKAMKKWWRQSLQNIFHWRLHFTSNYYPLGPRSSLPKWQLICASAFGSGWEQSARFRDEWKFKSHKSRRFFIIRNYGNKNVAIKLTSNGQTTDAFPRSCCCLDLGFSRRDFLGSKEYHGRFALEPRLISCYPYWNSI